MPKIQGIELSEDEELMALEDFIDEDEIMESNLTLEEKLEALENKNKIYENILYSGLEKKR